MYRNQIQSSICNEFNTDEISDTWAKLAYIHKMLQKQKEATRNHQK